MSDLISRQAAIDAMEQAKEQYFDRRVIIGKMQDIVNNLPSAQPKSYREGYQAGFKDAQPERKKPVFKTGESVYHVSYADGTGGFKKNKWADWTCPDCGWFVGEQYIPRRHNQQKCNYCAKCGCAIDWSDADMRGEQDE